jgi:hypothetical protein
MKDTILAALVGIMLVTGGAVAQSTDSDAAIYEGYDAGFDEVNTDDDWFYDYYDFESDIGTEVTPATDLGEDEGIVAPDYDWDFDWNDGDTTDLGGDDAGEEGVLDL